MKKLAAIFIIAGLFQLALGIGLIGFTVFSQQKQNAIFYGQSGIISADFSPVSSTIPYGDSIQFEVTVDTSSLGAECSAVFFWYRDGVMNQSEQFSGYGILGDSYVFVGSEFGTHAIEVVINVFPLDYSSYGDTVWCTGTVEVTSSSPTPTPVPSSSPTPSSSPSPSPNPTSTPAPTSTPPPKPPLEQWLMLALGLLLSVSGAVTLWLSKMLR
jgi:hypothetical protein